MPFLSPERNVSEGMQACCMASLLLHEHGCCAPACSRAAHSARLLCSCMHGVCAPACTVACACMHGCLQHLRTWQVNEGTPHSDTCPRLWLAPSRCQPPCILCLQAYFQGTLPSSCVLPPNTRMIVYRQAPVQMGCRLVEAPRFLHTCSQHARLRISHLVLCCLTCPALTLAGRLAPQVAAQACSKGQPHSQQLWHVGWRHPSRGAQLAQCSPGGQGHLDLHVGAALCTLCCA